MSKKKNWNKEYHFQFNEEFMKTEKRASNNNDEEEDDLMDYTMFDDDIEDDTEEEEEFKYKPNSDKIFTESEEDLESLKRSKPGPYLVQKLENFLLDIKINRRKRKWRREERFLSWMYR